MAELHDPVVKKRPWGRWFGIVCVVAGLLFIGGAQVRATQLTDRINHESDVRVATGCVAAWERAEQIRDGDEFVIRTNADTLLSFADADSDPAVLARFRELVEGDVAEVRANTTDPDCDLGDAKRLLAEEG